MNTIFIILSVLIMLVACWRDKPTLAGVAIGFGIVAGVIS